MKQLELIMNFIKKMYDEQQEKCDHISVIIGTNSDTFILDKDTGERTNPLYKKCLLCNKNLTYIDSYTTEFDARKYIGEDLSYNEMMEYYPEILELFKNILKSSDSENEAFVVFEKLLNEKNSKKIKSIT